MSSQSMPFPTTSSSGGIGGFLNPDKIVSEFGIEQGMRIADFGTGAGFFTIILGQKVGSEGKVYALDILEPALDNVIARAKVAGLSNIETIRANLEILGSTGLSDGSQDMVLMANILFQSNKKEEIIKEARRVLKDDCSLIVIDWMKGKGGFGPPDGLRTDEIAMQSLISGMGFVFIKKIDAGDFHFGILLKKGKAV